MKFRRGLICTPKNNGGETARFSTAHKNPAFSAGTFRPANQAVALGRNMDQKMNRRVGRMLGESKT